MRTIYVKPEAEIIDFYALQNLAVINDAAVINDDDHVKDDETGHVSRDF